ncbi:S-adenosyl-L-methionine-dependent methyltransferase [Gloeophyllum trabeum ATCC 11539]|uniref:S-adenosyl-L-methionine-dependent methyltransferase n=1 Tax=Gloeophyllum trabeum (strain ATCC 11539 / FP-39264 / Madison 617) TaxID=670483 RepID=S7RCD0_GLOTA|nr:S-adenosyl-L-methionine-dependent methyltransferase [Gloeophyllum trabeum ATCC 11539]EPQ51880.1 S-adenosyl-L-methionine-dependent methyltransferase [Gloeophyllum trabeum ATCC 11539]
MSTSTTSEISSLLETLTTSLDVFKAELVRQHFPEPSLLTSRPHAIDDPSYVTPPRMYEARRVAVSSLDRLRLLLESPAEALAVSCIASGEIQGVRLAAELGLHEVLADAQNPEEGEDVRVVAVKTRTDAPKLVNRGWFRETKAGWFANNRRSHMLQKGSKGYHCAKDMSFYMNNAIDKLPEAMTHPDESFRMSRNPERTAWNIYANSDLPFFGPRSWLSDKPGEAERFALGMGGYGVASDNGVTYDVPWMDFVKGKDAIVDVGGGQGTLCCALAAAYPEVKFVVQDLPATREAAEKYIASRGVAGRVIFEEQDFFEPNRRRGTGRYVFLMQKVLHDWSDEEGARILSNILDGESQMFIIDLIIPPTTVSPDGPSVKESLATVDIQGPYKPIPSPPFIPNDFGDMHRIAHSINICLISLCNSFERTYADMENMVRLAGMRIKTVTTTR